jgi:hypothetical protein
MLFPVMMTHDAMLEAILSFLLTVSIKKRHTQWTGVGDEKSLGDSSSLCGGSCLSQGFINPALQMNVSN